MAQHSGPMNSIIHDGNGSQQIIKVLPGGSSGKQVSGLKIVKVVSSKEASRIFSQNSMAGPHNIRTTGQNITHARGSIPISHTSHSETIKLSPSQMNALKMVGSSNQTKRIIAVPHPQVMTSTSSVKKPAATSSGRVQPRRRKTDKVGKGLRHFSMKVCEKVEEKGVTTYNEVADELVQEEIEGQPIDPMNYDQKNIRRRVYDALNVLMAMNIISKEKKEIRWIGLPTNSIQQCNSLEIENQKRRKRIEEKQRKLRDLLLKQVSFKSLVTRNKEAEEKGIIPTPDSAIQLPFIIVNTHKKTQTNCSIANDKSEYFFTFEDTFQIHDDVEVLKLMGLLLGLDKGECATEDIERAKSMVPKAFRKYIEMYGRGQDESPNDEYEPSYHEYMDSSDFITPKTEYCEEDEDDEMVATDSDID